MSGSNVYAETESWDVVSDDLSATEASQALMLIGKARRCGKFAELMQAVTEEEMKLALTLENQGMSDSSKRLRDDPSTPQVNVHVKLQGYGSSSDEHVHGVPMPPSSEDVLLPPAINSVAHWGMTVVTFGKYHKVKTYADILKDNSDDMVGYKKYLFDHFNHGSAQLRDLVSYLKACNYDPYGPKQGPVIPGAKIVRTFRKWLLRSHLQRFLICI